MTKETDYLVTSLMARHYREYPKDYLPHKIMFGFLACYAAFFVFFFVYSVIMHYAGCPVPSDMTPHEAWCEDWALYSYEHR